MDVPATFTQFLFRSSFCRRNWLFSDTIILRILIFPQFLDKIEKNTNYDVNTRKGLQKPFSWKFVPVPAFSHHGLLLRAIFSEEIAIEITCRVTSIEIQRKNNSWMDRIKDISINSRNRQVMHAVKQCCNIGGRFKLETLRVFFPLLERACALLLNHQIASDASRCIYLQLPFMISILLPR